MLRLLSTIIGLTVISQRESQALGVIEEPAADATKGVIVAYRTSGHPNYLSTIDILAYLDEGIVVQDDSILQDEDDLVRLKRLGDNRTTILNLKVVSETGKRMGRVSDVLIDTTTHHVTRLHIKPGGLRRFTGTELIIPRERVIKMTAQEVIVRYDNGTRPAGAEPEAI